MILRTVRVTWPIHSKPRASGDDPNDCAVFVDEVK